jgi:hypothetical protein
MFVRNNNDTRYHILRASACCRTSSAVKSPAVQTETVIVLISLTLMKVVSDNMADNPGLRFREPSRSPLINQSGYKMFNNKHRNFRDHALDPEIKFRGHMFVFTRSSYLGEKHITTNPMQYLSCQNEAFKDH